MTDYVRYRNLLYFVEAEKVKTRSFASINLAKKDSRRLQILGNTVKKATTKHGFDHKLQQLVRKEQQALAQALLGKGEI